MRHLFFITKGQRKKYPQVLTLVIDDLVLPPALYHDLNFLQHYSTERSQWYSKILLNLNLLGVLLEEALDALDDAVDL